MSTLARAVACGFMFVSGFVVALGLDRGPTVWTLCNALIGLVFAAVIVLGGRQS